MSPRYTNIFSKRDPLDVRDDGDHLEGWFYSKDTRTARYELFLVIFFLLAFILISYLHAQIRMTKGLAPLWYHSWLVSSKRRSQFESEALSETLPMPEHNFSFYQNGHELYVLPPPAYNPNLAQPPAYPGPPRPKTTPQEHPPPAYGYGGPSSSAVQQT
ncbi:hypothetical protein BGX38DRAFT_1208770 [Terfezia claveryi]|nr:hypothetical protein BGX38DRAFT_1208770 [Terfezia claveryi]